MSFLRKVGQKLGLAKPERTATAWDRLHREAGFIPLYNVDDTEARRNEIKEILLKSKKALFKPELKEEIVKEVYALYFYAGNPWYRGLDNRELAEKVSFFLQNYTEVGHLPSFIPDLFEEAMMLLNLSWQSLDVTNTPPYIIESRPIINPNPQKGIELSKMEFGREEKESESKE